MTVNVFHKIYLPKEDSPEETLKSYSSIERAVILEIAERFASAGTELFGANWFYNLLDRNDHFEYRNKWLNQWDPSFLFGELLFIAASPLAHCMPTTQGFYDNFDKCRRTRNLWAHDFYPRFLSDLKKDVVSFKLISSMSGLSVAPYIDLVTERINAIHTGNWPPASEVPNVVETKTSVPADAQADFENSDKQRELEREKKQHHKQLRPVVGSRWLGPAPTRRARLQVTLGDVVDCVTGSSLRNELGELADETIARWVQLRPNGDLLIDDQDNAVMGWVEGVPRLIGYLGPEPAVMKDEIRGFLHPEKYQISDGQVISKATGLSLLDAGAENAVATTASILEAATEHDDIYISTYGDIVKVGDLGIVRILNVAPGFWFPHE